MVPTWVLSAPDGPHVGPINLGIRVVAQIMRTVRRWWRYRATRRGLIINKQSIIHHQKARSSCPFIRLTINTVNVAALISIHLAFVSNWGTLKLSIQKTSGHSLVWLPTPREFSPMSLLTVSAQSNNYMFLITSKWNENNNRYRYLVIINRIRFRRKIPIPDNKVHGANMKPTWVLSAPDLPHVGPMNFATRDV